jgi:segregation and condensation protein A
MTKEEQIMDFIKSDFSWEQVIYKIVAWEGMDPWNLDLVKLSDSFIVYITKLKEVNFKIPAKYIIISAVLLRMKSDHLQYMGDLVEETFSMDAIEDGLEEHIEAGAGLEDQEESGNGLAGFVVNPITVPPRRQPRRKIVVEDLVAALRRAMKAETRKDIKEKTHREKIQVKEDNITKRISALYNKINDMLGRFRKEEVEFKDLVDKWERHEVVDTFLPLVFLDHEKKVEVVQEEMFKEIYIKRRPEEKGRVIRLVRRRTISKPAPGRKRS